MYRFTVLLASAALAAAACGVKAGPPGAEVSAGELSGTVTVFAAASLTESFDALAAAFQRAHPGVAFAASYAGSPTLVAQIVAGADADIFASADEANMRKLVDAKLIDGAPEIFAGNALQIVVQAGNPKQIRVLADLAQRDLVVVLAAPSVPVGAYGNQALAKAGVEVTPKSLETDVKLVLSKVALGEADAGIVYRTDVKAAGSKIEGVDIPDEYNVKASYPIAVVKGSRHAAAARAFVDYIRSADGRAVLASFGFIVP